MTAPGIGGTLIPGGFLDEASAVPELAAAAPGLARALTRWWVMVARSCGPATGIRTLHDRVAGPVFGMLGFEMQEVAFGDQCATARLITREGATAGLVERTWSTRRPTIWRDAANAARAAGSRWCFVLAPPYLSLVDARGQARRRSLDFVWPEALATPAVDWFVRLTSAAAFAGSPSRLERLIQAAARFEARVGRDLQQGVLQALDELPAAVGSRAGRSASRDALEETLTIVFRVLFLLFAESRHLVPVAHPLYGAAYSVGSLCRQAADGDARGLWPALAAVTRLARDGCTFDDLRVAPFNGQLFARAAAPTLERRTPRARDPRSAPLGRALVSIGTRTGHAGRQRISYSDLGVEELGSVYERVLDREPGRRKQTGTFYTPQALAAFVVRRTLAPLVAGRRADEILALRVVDPAMGSGAFLVAACRFLADAYEQALIDEGRLAAHDVDDDRRAVLRRRVAERCLSGVDLNATAVQLARLSLWLTTLSRGRPLSFLDHQLRVGNSLIGAGPDDLQRPGPGRTRPRAPLPLFDDQELGAAMRAIAAPMRNLRERVDDSLTDVRAKEAGWADLNAPRAPLWSWRLAASLWCARWFWAERTSRRADSDAPPSDAELRAALDGILNNDLSLPAPVLDRWLTRAAELSRSLQFFHWPLEFADAFYEPSGLPAACPGFDAVIGNPPWEMLRKDSGPAVAGVPPTGAVLRFVRQSGIYPACDRGHINLYQPFIDRAVDLTRTGGRIGLVLPWSVATDDGAAALRRRLADECGLDTMVGIDNAKGLFPVHRSLRFAVVTGRRGARSDTVRARLGVSRTETLDGLPGRADDDAEDLAAYPVRLTRATWRQVGGSTGRFPDARSPADLEWLASLSSRHPRLGAADGWQLRFGRDLNATDDRGSFGSRGLPVLDGRHIEPFVAHVDRVTRHVAEGTAARRFADRRFDRPRLAYRDVSGVGNRRCLIAAVLPAGVLTTHTLFCLRTVLDDERQHYLCALLNSSVLDRAARMLMGSHVTTSLVLDLPAPVWRGTPAQRRLAALARAAARGADVGRRLQTLADDQLVPRPAL